MTQPKPTPTQLAVGGTSGQVLTHNGSDISWTTVSSSSASLTKTTASRTTGTTPVTLTVPAGEDVVCISIETAGTNRSCSPGFNTTTNTSNKSFRVLYEVGANFTSSDPVVVSLANNYAYISYTSSTRNVSIELKQALVSGGVSGGGLGNLTVLGGTINVEMWSSS